MQKVERVGKLVDSDDDANLPAEEVGRWVRDKHGSLCRYIDISRGVRSKFIGDGKGGAAYIDLFCGPGRAKIRRTGEFVDGSCVAAWKESVKSRAPFSTVIIADADDQRRQAAAERLRRLGAPVTEVNGDALEAARNLQKTVPPYALKFAFLDPYNLEAFDFEVIEHLTKFTRMDMLAHISKMDLQRNTGMNIAAERSAFDKFAPGWRDVVDLTQKHTAVRRAVFDHWRERVTSLGVLGIGCLALRHRLAFLLTS